MKPPQPYLYQANGTSHRVAFVAEQLLPDNDTPQQVMFITDAFFDENQYNSLRSVSVPRDYDPLSQEQREESLHNFDSRARVVLHELTHMNVLGVQGEIGKCLRAPENPNLLTSYRRSCRCELVRCEYQ